MVRGVSKEGGMGRPWPLGQLKVWWLLFFQFVLREIAFPKLLSLSLWKYSPENHSKLTLLSKFDTMTRTTLCACQTVPVKRCQFTAITMTIVWADVYFLGKKSPHCNDPIYPDLKKLLSLSERLAFLGTMGTQTKTPVQTLYTIVPWWFGKFQVGPQLDPMMPRDASLSDIYSSGNCCISSLVIYEARASLKRILRSQHTGLIPC